MKCDLNDNFGICHFDKFNFIIDVLSCENSNIGVIAIYPLFSVSDAEFLSATSHLLKNNLLNRQQIEIFLGHINPIYLKITQFQICT